MDKILLGKPVAKAINEITKSQIEMHHLKPLMSLIQIGVDPASSYYIKSIIKQAEQLGCDVHLIQLEEKISTQELSAIIQKNNISPDVHGIMLQKPFPGHIDENVINNSISEFKDIDGISPVNIGKIYLEQPSFVPCTAAAVIELARYYNIEFSGKHVVVIGRSNVVGKPLVGLLLQKSSLGNATVTVCHSKTKDIEIITKTADIIIAAIGKPNFIKADMIKPDSICIDVGINQIKDDNLKDIYVGDIDYNQCFERSLAITPVPGGIGTVTTAILLNNLVKAATLSFNVEKLLT